MADDLAARHPDSNASYGVHIVPLRQALNFAYEIFRPLSIVLSATVGLVLLVACANVTSVLLARAMGRRREIAIRLALGSSRARLLRQLLTESTALAIAGGAGGVLFAWRELRVMDASIPDDIYRVGRIGLDPQALVFALCVSVMTAMLVGFAPAWRSSRRDLRSALNEISHATTAPPQARRAQSALVVAQLALTLALVVSAALMIQSVLKLQRVDPGFDPQVLSMKVVLPRETYGGSAELRQFQRRVLEGARTVAGLEAAAIVNYLPLNHEIDLRTFSAGTAVAPAKPPAATVVTVTPDYFRTMNIPIRRGRAFTDQDDERAGRVAMIGEGLARRFFPDRDPVGQPLKLERRGGATDATIVGVAADSRFESLAGAEAPQIYLPQAQEPSRYLRLVARGASGLSAGLAAPLRRAIASVHPGLPVTEVRTMAAVLDESLLPQRGLSRALIALAIGALLLAVVGIYGVMAYFVSARTRELAIRLTLGAAPCDVARMVLARSARITAAGVVLGAAIALALARLAASFLFGVSATDVTTVAAAAAGLAAVSLFATYAPVRRAARLDPAATLRGD